MNNNLGNIYLKKALYNDSITHYQKAISRAPSDPKIWYTLSLSYIKSGQFAKAADSLGKVIGIDPAFWDAYYQYGLLLIKENRTEDGKQILRTLLEKNPEYENRQEVDELLSE